jgi:hypothetical protein
MPNNNSGISFALSLKLGIFIENINRRVDRLYPHIESSLMMHNLYESFPLKDNKKRFDENHSKLITYINDEVKGINKQIKGANRILKLLKYKRQILPIDFISIRTAINERFNEIFKESKPQEISNQNLKLKLSNVISKTSKSIFDLITYAKDRESFEGVDKLTKIYQDLVENAIDIYSFGHFNTSLFLLGNTLEYVLDDSIRKLIKDKKIRRIYPRKTKYINKIGILKENKFIDERLFHELNTVRIDRDETGHPTNRKCSSEECQNMINRVILIISQLQKKLS